MNRDKKSEKYSNGRPATTRPVLVRVPTDVKRQLEEIRMEDETLGAVVRRLLEAHHRERDGHGVAKG